MVKLAKKKSQGGRPTRMTNAVVSKLEIAFAIGANTTEACLVAGISRDTYYRFIKERPKYADRFAELRQRPIMAAKKRVVDAIVEDDDTGTARWYLERRCRDEFSQHQRVDMSVEAKPPMTEEYIAKRLAELIEMTKQIKQEADEGKHVG